MLCLRQNMLFKKEYLISIHLFRTKVAVVREPGDVVRPRRDPGLLSPQPLPGRVQGRDRADPAPQQADRRQRGQLHGDERRTALARQGWGDCPAEAAVQLDDDDVRRRFVRGGDR